MEISLQKQPISNESWTYENFGSSTYYVYQLQEKDEIDTLGLGMMTSNTIPGLAPIVYTQRDNSKFFKYNVSSKILVSQVFSGIVNKKRLCGVMLGVVNAIMSADDYMIDTRSILVDVNKMFMDISTGDTILICLPVLCTDAVNTDYLQFFKKLLFTTQFDQSENCNYVTELINFFNHSSTLVMEDLKKLLLTLTDEKSVSVPQIPINNNVVSTPVNTLSNNNNESVFGIGNQNSVVPSSIPSINTEANNNNNTPLGIKAPPILQKIGNGNGESKNNKKSNEQPMPNMNIPSPVPGMNIPSMPVNKKQDKAQTPSEADNNTSDGSDKEISFLYLMQHYNKENAAAYKAQKQAKKTKGAAAAPATQKKNASTVPNMNVPGMPNMNIPGAPNINTPVNPNGNLGVNTNTSNTKPDMGMPNPVNIQPNNVVPQVNNSFGGVQQNVNIPPVVQNNNNYFSNNMSMGSFGDTTVLSEDVSDGTTVLGPSMVVKQKSALLIRVKNQERIPINSNLFRIGKERSFVDYFIGDNTAISRSHANIIKKDDKYYIVDTNSTNHTYVNGEIITSNSEIELEDGTQIKLANEEFTFKYE